jgi:dTDP-4-dehydrorhamnose reductase
VKKILIIGVSGLLGNKIYNLAKNNYQVFGTYNTHKPSMENVYQLDVTKRADVFKLIENIKPDFVIDTHALHNVDYCELHPEEAWLVNVEGTKNVAEACRTFGCKYVFISTDYVFDGKKATPYTEKDKPNPLNYYAKTKLIAEEAIKILTTDYIIARTAVLFGVGGLGKEPFALWLIKKLKNGEEVKAVIDQYNNPTLVDSLAKILLTLCENDKVGLFHIAGKTNLNRYEFSLKIAETFGLNKELIKSITTPELNQVAPRPRKVALDVSKVERATKLKALTIDEALNIFKQQVSL